MGTARLVTFTSGKEGVGKTSLVVNFAVELARQGQRVCVMDAAGGKTCVAHLFGVEPAATLNDVIAGEVLLREALVAVDGVTVVASARAAGELFDLDTRRRSRLLTALGELESRFDYLLIDAPAGTGDPVVRFAQASHNVVLVVTPERQSRLDAFALIKALHLNKVEAHLHLLCNLVSSRRQSRQVFDSLQAAVKTYVGGQIHYLGLVGPDPSVSAAIAARRPFTLEARRNLAGRCLQYLAAHARTLFGDNGEAGDESHAEDTGDTVDTGDIRGLGAYWMRSLFAGQKPVKSVNAEPVEAKPETGHAVPTLPPPASPWAMLREQLRLGTLARGSFLDEIAAILRDERCFETGSPRRQALATLSSLVLDEQGPWTDAHPGQPQARTAQPATAPGAGSGTLVDRDRAGLAQAVRMAARVGRGSPG